LARGYVAEAPAGSKMRSY